MKELKSVVLTFGKLNNLIWKVQSKRSLW